jgi:hypothetical protein
MDRAGESVTILGQVFGMLGTLLFGLGIAGAFLWTVAAAASVQGMR